MSEEQSRLEVLSERGHGNCLEAILLTPDAQVRRNKLRNYIDNHREHGINTKHTRRASRALETIEVATAKPQKNRKKGKGKK